MANIDLEKKRQVLDVVIELSKQNIRANQEDWTACGFAEKFGRALWSMRTAEEIVRDHELAIAEMSYVHASVRASLEVDADERNKENEK